MSFFTHTFESCFKEEQYDQQDTMDINNETLSQNSVYGLFT